MLKFDRRYRAEFVVGVYENNKPIPQEAFIVEYPFTCNFMVDLGIHGTANHGAFQFYNLSEETQAKLWFDLYETGKKYIDINFYAGYGDNLVLVFSGRTSECTSYRASGSVDKITQLNAFNAGNFYQYGYINETFTAGTTLDVILQRLLDETGVKLGYITPEINKPLQRDKTFIGQTWDLLGREYGGYNIFIDKGELNILGDNDVVPGDILVITDSSGLLGSPRRANGYTELDMIFEPQLRIGQAVEVLSDSMPRFNRAYEVITIKHKGIISPVVCGKLTTTPTLSMFASNYRTLEKQKTEYSANTTGQWTKPITTGFKRISDYFGYRIHPITKQRIFHQGLDIAAPQDTPVYAPANGKIISASWRGGYGKAVEIDNGNINGKRVSSLYAHLNNWVVNSGQQIFQGDLIGYVGSTGKSTGPHLHFGIKENGNWTNPIEYIGNYG